jgi:hypothetical protein
MNLRMKAGCCLVVLMLAATSARAQIFSPIPPDVWPPVVGAPVSVNDIWLWIRDRNYAALWRLAKDQAIKAARDEVQRQLKGQIKSAKLAARINLVLEDPIMTLSQKYDALIQFTDSSFETNGSAPSGLLNVTLKHSIELGVTRLEWDDKVRDGSQSEYRATGECSGTTTSMNCRWGGRYSRCYYRSQPDYYIYRIVNGEQTLITALRGSMYSSPNSGFQFNAKLWDLAWNAAKYYYTDVLHGTYPNPVPGRAFFYDFQAELRPPGSTLSYRVDTFDDWLFPVFDSDGDGFGDAVACGAATGRLNTTTVTADANGDGRMDYLTAADYSRYWGKYMGWLPGVINSTLD